MHEWKGDREEEKKSSEGRKERKKKGRKKGIKITHGTVFYDNFKKNNQLQYLAHSRNK